MARSYWGEHALPRALRGPVQIARPKFIVNDLRNVERTCMLDYISVSFQFRKHFEFEHPNHSKNSSTDLLRGAGKTLRISERAQNPAKSTMYHPMKFRINIWDQDCAATGADETCYSQHSKNIFVSKRSVDVKLLHASHPPDSSRTRLVSRVRAC